jgi:hypothetical protein
MEKVVNEAVRLLHWPDRISTDNVRYRREEAPVHGQAYPHPIDPNTRGILRKGAAPQRMEL